MKSHEEKMNILIENLQKKLTAINTIALQYAVEYLLTKIKLENNQT
jgi:hypothetical protein